MIDPDSADGMLLRTLLLVSLACTAPAVASAPRLLVLGDSLSAGYGLEPGTGWVRLLEQRLQAKHLEFQVVNASISGDTTAGGLRRLPALLAEHRPEVVLVELGANDGLRGLPLTTIRSNLDRLVAQAQAAAPAVVLIGLRMPPNYGPRYADGFHALFREVAENRGVALVPLLLGGIGERLDLMQADGLHPVAEAQPLMLDNVWPALVPLLAGQP